MKTLIYCICFVLGSSLALAVEQVKQESHGDKVECEHMRTVFEKDLNAIYRQEIAKKRLSKVTINVKMIRCHAPAIPIVILKQELAKLYTEENGNATLYCLQLNTLLQLFQDEETGKYDATILDTAPSIGPVPCKEYYKLLEDVKQLQKNKGQEKK